MVSSVLLDSAPAGATVAKWNVRGRVSLPSLSIKLALEGWASIERGDSSFQGIYERSVADAGGPTWAAALG